MAKATKLFLSSVILLLYTGLFIQGASEYGDVMEHIPVRSMKTLDPRVSLASTRKICGPCNCCPGNSNCYSAKCCYLSTCNGGGPTGGCITRILACNCNNCV
ncbi:hypothetical protein PVAP13_3NG033000 [Panicum virgatum]|uniref:Uncharacterized protein n=1 Tax=Panicum virgatum TaxID=38727 RepID=A0A8T0TYV1_PANVG|nr:hypothetical protein PVAP13_3NG237470 [Panicum virgatum]KAG2615248.1 hypothetical protein PVAP13_3NG237470 [Panicum virgatum]KAG2615249.1 hypothetical protein PVAP13_3NG033000 [Panicum virgatum]